MSEIETARQALVERILNGDGTASHTQRRDAFDTTALTEPLTTLIDKVRKHAGEISDQDFNAAMNSGLTEDQLFEIVICAAVGQSTREYDAALAALNSAAEGE